MWRLAGHLQDPETFLTLSTWVPASSLGKIFIYLLFKCLYLFRDKEIMKEVYLVWFGLACKKIQFSSQTIIDNLHVKKLKFLFHCHCISILPDLLSAKQTYTLWLYQLLQKHLLICCTKLHYIDFDGPLMSLSHIDIWYLVSNNPTICQTSWKMTYRKKAKIFGVGSKWHIFWCINF